MGEPECNGVMDCGIRTLQAECLYLRDFVAFEEARQVIGEFIERYSAGWLLEGRDCRTPAEVCRALTHRAA